MIKFERASESLFELSNKMQDELAGGATLEEAAQKISLHAKSITAVDRNGRNPNGLAVAEVEEIAEALVPIFGAREKEVSDLIETSAAGYVIFRIDGITPAVLRPLETMRDVVIADWKIAERNKAAEKRAAELVTRLGEARTMEAVAREDNTSVRTSPALTRQGPLTDSAVSPQLLANLFEAKVGDYLTAPAADGNGFVIARLKEIQAPTAEGDSRMTGLRRNLETAIANDILAQFETAARSELSVTVNRSVVDSIDLQTGSVNRQSNVGGGTGLGGLLGF
jgi:peptidyl-prolyl cis-trans isomerase D